MKTKENTQKKRLLMICVLPALLVMLTGAQWGVETITRKNGTDFEKILSDNNIFFKSCRDFAFEPESNVVYFLESTYGKIFKVEWPSGKLIKTISRKGQGPAELHKPFRLIIKNKKIFVLDRGFNGVKVFDYDGASVSQFRFRHILEDSRDIAVNGANEIFIGKPDTANNTMVSVYDMKGKKLRSLIPIPGGKEAIADDRISRDQFVLKIDNKGNIYLLFYMLRQLAKYDPKGNQLWEITLKNELVDRHPNTNYYRKEGNTTNSRSSVFNIETLPDGRIVVGHTGGGCILDEKGTLKKLLHLGCDLDGMTFHVGLMRFRVKDGVALNLLMRGKYIFYYKLPI